MSDATGVHLEKRDGAREKETGLPIPFSHPHPTQASSTPHNAALNSRPHPHWQTLLRLAPWPAALMEEVL